MAVEQRPSVDIVERQNNHHPVILMEPQILNNRTGVAYEIEVGKHGIYIIKGYRRGTLLPQVATDHGWDTETFLAQTSRKAGLSEDAWKEGDTEIYIYDAIVFGEGER